MDLEDVAPTVGVGACVALLVALGVPYVAVSGGEAVLGAYYASGPVGVGGVAFMALLTVVVFLSGTRGTAEPDLVAGLALVLGVATFLLTVVWALAVDETLLFNLPASATWMTSHRWVVVAVAAVVPLGAAGYVRGVLWP
ncbi:hypothetical protein SAMN04487950_2362 [Halogranum rubrum]|uniref:Uncharacterized protein n=2 Tax=Halogranum rubrum TaxID=553466 RepID=A0A1I4ERW7_9EURY|nr:MULTISPECIES: hypothetical protein [Halogranum]EJN60250.1 hypothetical protein HSB1_08530 [Halogranum salarium B-1]SFL08462.1 hypothetical protein SAMN04487950_2362 [Halogranum rubrum]